MQRIRLLLPVIAFIACASVCTAATREMLVRLPLLSEKNAALISSALDIPGVNDVSACYELKVMIVEYNDVVTNEQSLMNVITSNAGNTSAEKINSSDIWIIRDHYKISYLKRKDK
jgi:hypothetical protein